MVSVLRALSKLGTVGLNGQLSSSLSMINSEEESIYTPEKYNFLIPLAMTTQLKNSTLHWILTILSRCAVDTLLPVMTSAAHYVPVVRWTTGNMFSKHAGERSQGTLLLRTARLQKWIWHSGFRDIHEVSLWLFSCVLSAVRKFVYSTVVT